MYLSDQDFRQVVKNTPLVAVDMMVFDPSGKALLGTRKNPPAKGMWFVPGGRIRKDEGMEDAIARITKDEIGLVAQLKDLEFYGIFEHIYPDNVFLDPSFGSHYLVMAVKLRLKKVPDLNLDQQHLDQKFWSIDDILSSSDVHQYAKAYFMQKPHNCVFKMPDMSV